MTTNNIAIITVICVVCTFLLNCARDIVHIVRHAKTESKDETFQNATILARLDQMVGDLLEIKSELKDVKKDLAEMRERFGQLDMKVEAMHSREDERDSTISTLTTRMSKVETDIEILKRG